ncbi:MAG: DUF885 domain-containing protein [Planctomycetota bacterium]
MIHRTIPALALLVLPCACETVASVPPPEYSWPDTAAGVDDEDLADLCRDAWELRMRADPVGATRLGDPRYHGKLADNSLEGSEAHAELIRDLLVRAEAIGSDELGGGDRVTLRLLQDAWRIDLAQHDSGIDVASWSLDARGGPQVDFLSLAEDQPVGTTTERAQLLERWQRMPLSIDRSAANLRRGLAVGRVASKKAVLQVIAQLDSVLATSGEESPLAQPALGGGTWAAPIPGDRDFAVLSSRQGVRAESIRVLNEFMASRGRGTEGRILVPAKDDPLPPAERGRFAAAVLRVVQDSIRPAFERYRDLLRDEVLPRARDDEHPGLLALPGGAEHYRLCILRETSLELSPEEIHEFGLAEVAKIRAEIAELGTRVFGISDVAAIQRKLRDSPEMHFSSAAEIVAKAESTLARAQEAMPRTFGLLPRARCEIAVIPAHEAPLTTIAYYRQPSADRSRPGRYYVNTFAPATRTRYEAEALAFHEAIPGHHLQIAIAQELEGLPLIRRHDGNNAYVEGWALYTERLCDEMGLYTSDLDRLGMLSFDAWRACRLVVDTGLHALGWSRQRAIDYMIENTLLAENNVENEVDRYIGNPGQALGYKIGQREIFDLRAKAMAALGDRFDIRKFHDRVLGQGAVTLAVLREEIADWIASAPPAPAPAGP